MGRIDDKVAIITGASAGLGEGTAELFAREGGTLVLTARRKDRLDALAERIEDTGGLVLAVAGDMPVVEDVNRVVDVAIAAFGPIDSLVNNGGKRRKGRSPACLS